MNLKPLVPCVTHAAYIGLVVALVAFGLSVAALSVALVALIGQVNG